VAGKLEEGVNIWVCDCFGGDRRIWEVVSSVLDFCLDLVVGSKLGLLHAAVVGIGVCLS
jgi:hypothetical protein